MTPRPCRRSSSGSRSPRRRRWSRASAKRSHSLPSSRTRARRPSGTSGTRYGVLVIWWFWPQYSEYPILILINHQSQDETYANEVITAEFLSIAPRPQIWGRFDARIWLFVFSVFHIHVPVPWHLSASVLVFFCRKSLPIWKTNRQEVDQNTAPEFWLLKVYRA